MVTTVLGELVVTGQALAGSGGLTVLVRPEQIMLEAVSDAEREGSVVDYRYYGHDAVVTVLLDRGGHRVVARATGGPVLAAGQSVAVRVAGPVVAWPA
jgi:iron(III) transport system ATP-binding protein